MTKTFNEYFGQYVPDNHGTPKLPQQLTSAPYAASETGHSSSHSPVSRQPSMQYTPSGQFDWDEKERKENKQMLIAFSVCAVALVLLGVFGPMVFQ